MTQLTRTSSKQIAGLTDEQAAEIRANLVWLESAPTWAYDRAAESFDDWASNTTDASECFAATDATDDGFLWQDENGDEWEHLCC